MTYHEDPRASDRRSADPGITAQHESNSGEPGICYLLHFSEPYKHAGHYSGFATDLQARLAVHEKGNGARLLQVAKAAGITWTLARTWPGDRSRERQLKNQGGASRRCPECGVTPLTTPAERKEPPGMRQPQDNDPRQVEAPQQPPGTWMRTQLRDQIQRTGAALAGPGQPRGRERREPDSEPVAELEAEP